MGERAAKTVSEIDGIKRRVESNIAALDDRLPHAIQTLRKAGAAAGGAGGLGIALTVLRKLRKRKEKAKARVSEASVQAAAVPAKTVNHTNISLVPKGAGNLVSLALVGWVGLKVYRAIQERKAIEQAGITRLPTSRSN